MAYIISLLICLLIVPCAYATNFVTTNGVTMTFQGGVAVSEISATGIANTKYLRGDGTWNTPAGGGGGAGNPVYLEGDGGADTTDNLANSISLTFHAYDFDTSIVDNEMLAEINQTSRTYFKEGHTAYGWGDHSAAGYISDVTYTGYVKGVTYTGYVKGVTYTSVNNMGDVDTVSDAPAKNEVLKWNGSQWVPAAYDANFTFSVATFSDGEATSQLIGSGVWEADEAMTFAATYNNGPPTSADVLMSNNGGAYAKKGEMTGPDYTSGTNTEGDINYPAAKSQYLRFRLDASDGVDSESEYETAIYFYNYNYYGKIAKDSGFTEADIEGLTPYYDTDSNYSVAINAGAGEYIVYAFPTSYTALDEGDDYEDDGASDFRFNSVVIAMTQDNANLSITNAAGYTENYDVYVSNEANLGNHTFVANTGYSGSAQYNYIWYGKTTDASGYNEADVEGCANSEATTDATQVWDSVTIGAGEYLLFCFPKRLGTKGVEYTFYDYGTGLGFDFQAAETVSVTNANGWTEDYYVYRSTNANLGACVVETK